MFTTLFSSLTTRILFSALTSLLVALLIGPEVIRNLKQRQIGQTIRDEGVQAHKKKAGIPTMGGIIILIPLVLNVFFWANINTYVLVTLFCILGIAFIGLMDDLTKVLKARSLGLTPRQKLFGQITIALLSGLVVWKLPGLRFAGSLSLGSDLFPVPSSSTLTPIIGLTNLGWLYLPFVTAVIVGSCNAVNLTDGLDGLASGTVAIAILPFLVIAFVTGNAFLAKSWGVIHVAGAEELCIICASICGGALGFLWYNAHPAEVFMGDTGSLALGAAFGAIAVCTKTELFLVIIGGIFVLEALSVIIQVSYFKYTGGKRVFRMSPIHHHFELCGWAEEKVTLRFWIIGLVLAFSGLVLFAWKILF